MSAPVGPGPLISAAGLTAALALPQPPAVLDVRWRLGGPPGIDGYRAGHLPGAVFCDLDRDLAGPPGGPDGRSGRHPLPDPAAFQAAMRRAGISAGTDVVVYDDADSTAAARAWWTLRYFGHHRVRVLDGGYRAWTAAGLPSVTGELPAGGESSVVGQPSAGGESSGGGELSGAGQSSAGGESSGGGQSSGSGEPAVAPGTFTARPGGMPLLDAAAAAALARSGIQLDARAAERYRGESEPVDPVAGHIPGAV